MNRVHELQTIRPSMKQRPRDMHGMGDNELHYNQKVTFQPKEVPIRTS